MATSGKSQGLKAFVTRGEQRGSVSDATTRGSSKVEQSKLSGIINILN